MSYVEYNTHDQTDDNPLPALARVNGFTVEDLEQNRAGRISNTQFSRLFRRAFRPLRYSVGALAGWLLCCWVVDTLVPDIVLTIASMIGGKSITGVFLAVTLTCAGAVFVSLLKTGRRTILLLKDLSAGKAVCLDGRVSASREDVQGLGLARLWGENHTNTWYVVQNEYFEVDQEACSALQPGERYLLYHTPRSKLLLSIEPARGSRS